MEIVKIYGIIETTEDSCFEEFHTTPKGAEEAIAKRPRKKWSGGGGRYTTEELDLIVDSGGDVIPRHAVAEALAALRAELERKLKACDADKSKWANGVRTGTTASLHSLDATIAKLDPGAAQEEGK